MKLLIMQPIKIIINIINFIFIFVVVVWISSVLLLLLYN
jgi:hypothetical protein